MDIVVPAVIKDIAFHELKPGMQIWFGTWFFAQPAILGEVLSWEGGKVCVRCPDIQPPESQRSFGVSDIFNIQQRLL